MACSILIFGDVFGWENFFGLCFVLAGIAAYNYHRCCARGRAGGGGGGAGDGEIVMGVGGTAGAAADGVGSVGGVSANGVTNGEYVPTVTMRKFGSSTPRLPTRRD